MLSVLVLDDDEVMKGIFKVYFKRTGITFKMDFSQNIPHARSLLATKKHDLVFTDYYLGNRTTGIDFLSEVMPLYPQTLFFLFSGYLDEELIDIAVKAGLELGQMFGKENLSTEFIIKLLGHNAHKLDKVGRDLK